MKQMCTFNITCEYYGIFLEPSTKRFRKAMIDHKILLGATINCTAICYKCLPEIYNKIINKILHMLVI